MQAAPLLRAVLTVVLASLAACKISDSSPKTNAPDGRTSTTAGGTVSVDYDGVASNVVAKNLGVREGDVVLISGSPRDLELLENLAVETRRVGAYPLVTLGTDRMSRRMYDDVPAKYDSQPAVVSRKLIDLANVMIMVDATEDSKALAGVPAERIAARAKTFAPVMELAFKRGIRSVEIGNNLYPTAERAGQFKMSRDALATMFWGGVNASPDTLHARGDAIRAALTGARELRITNPNGTDLTISVAGRSVLVNDGRIDPGDAKQGTGASAIYLPAGEVYLVPVPGTARGTVVVDNEFYQGQEIQGLKLVFAGGKVTAITAASGDVPWKPLFDAASPGKDELAFVDIGINPGVKAPAGARLNTWVVEGMVTVGLGANTWAGGTNASSFATSHFLPGSTVTVDGKVIVENGVLKPM